MWLTLRSYWTDLPEASILSLVVDSFRLTSYSHCPHSVSQTSDKLPIPPPNHSSVKLQSQWRPLSPSELPKLIWPLLLALPANPHGPNTLSPSLPHEFLLSLPISA